MFSSPKRLIYALSNKIRQRNPEPSSEGKLIVDFSKGKDSPFDIKSESSYNSYLSNGSLELGLKKPNCIAWVDIPDQEYHDHIIEAKIRLDSLGGYASTGIIFRIEDEDSYYLALVSSKGYFRLDAVKGGSPKTLIAWTEISDFDGVNINLNIVTYGTFIIFIVNGKWAGETNDDSISDGRLGFVLASYETTSPEAASYETASSEDGETKPAGANTYTCKAWLDYLSVDARLKMIEESYKKWSNDSNINAEGRLRLAETFAVMGEHSRALEQINRAWKRRDEAIRSVSVSYTEVRTKKELLLAAQMSFNLGQNSEAEKYIDAIIDQWPNTPEGKLACSEKLRLLNDQKRFAELKVVILKHSNIIEKNIDYYTLLARCYWELKEYKDSAKAWDKAFKMKGENGVYAVNAANALALLGKREEALKRFFAAGKIFLKQDNQAELTAMMPKFISLDEKNWEVHALAGKWAFSIEDYDRCAAEFADSEKFRRALKPRPKADPALFYLWALVFNIKGKNKDAIRLLEKAVKLAPDYGLFRFKLAEMNLKSGIKDPKFVEELKYALELSGDDPEGNMANHAGNLLMEAGYEEDAKYFFDMAKKE